MFGVGTKLEESIIKSNNQINSTVATRTWVLSTEWTRTRPSARLVCEWKHSGCPRLLEWWMLFFRACVCVLYCINKDKDDEDLPLLAFRRDVVNAKFLKYSKESKLSSSHVGIQNIPSHVCYNDTKHYQVKSEHKRIQNPLKHGRWSVFAGTVNGLKSILDDWEGS